ncbi:hypothetical protein [Algoriella sp.]|uniref:hypothetical protein n=1 Tax=Algoriella sp. TaxID=1872434 RepID=UPI002FC7B143
MKYNLFTLLIFLFLGNMLFAQQKYKNPDFLFGPTIGYTNQAGNFGKIGAFGEVFLGNYYVLKLDVNANMSYMRDDFQLIPEAGFSFYIMPERSGGLAFFAETEFTPYTFTPKIGLSYITFIDFGFGYGIEMKQKQNFKSIDKFQFSFGLNIPLNFNIY